MKRYFGFSTQFLVSAFLSFLGIGLISPIVSAQSNTGTTGAVELKIPVGAREIAMGETGAAVADDANAVYWNPAGLNQLGGTELTAQYDVFIETVSYNFFAAATKLDNNAALGLGAKIIGTGSEPGVGTSLNVSESYMDIDLAGAYRLSYYFDVGVNVKYINKNLSGTGASDFAADLGLLYRTPIPHLKAGLDIQNLGPGIKFEQVADPLPTNIKVGLAYKMFEDNLTLAYDMNFPNDNAISANFGGEYWYRDTLVGRFGYQFQGSIDQNEVGIGAEAGLFLGAGVKVQVFKNYISLDYAWTSQGFLGANHHFALDVYF